jgi:hypothetical protein
MRHDDRHIAISDEEAQRRAAEAEAEVDAGDIEENGNKVPKPLGQEAPEIVEDASKIGAKRLRRPLLGDTIAAFTGGMSVGFGAIAMAGSAASVGGSLAEP